MIELVEFSGEYDAIAEIHSRNRPDFPRSGVLLREWDERFEPGQFHRRVLAALDGELAGYGLLCTDRYDPTPGRMLLQVHVHPDRVERGVGTALFSELMGTAREQRASVLSSGARLEESRALRFLAARDFRERYRHLMSTLDLTTWEPGESRAIEGVEIEPLSVRYEREGRGLVHRKLLALIRDFTRDIPGGENSASDATVDDVVRNLSGSDLIPEAYFIASAGDEYVAKSCLRDNAPPDSALAPCGRALETGSTGVARAWRRKGLARLLKHTVLAWAKARGVPEIQTANEATNREILSLNRELGFVTRSEFGVFERELG